MLEDKTNYKRINRGEWERKEGSILIWESGQSSEPTAFEQGLEGRTICLGKAREKAIPGNGMSLLKFQKYKS